MLRTSPVRFLALGRGRAGIHCSYRTYNASERSERSTDPFR